MTFGDMAKHLLDFMCHAPHTSGLLLQAMVLPHTTHSGRIAHSPEAWGYFANRSLVDHT